MRLAVGLAVLLAVLPAEARVHAPYRAHRIVPGGVAPLDGILTAPTEAYSFRRLRSAYAGPAVKLRRTTGGTQDINFLGFVPGLGAPFDVAAAAAFCAATTCFIDTWYDQSGNGRNATQATPASQPAYVANCGGGMPCMQTTAAQLLLSPSVTPIAGPISYSAVAARMAGTTSYCAPILAYSGAPNYFAFNAAANLFFLYDGTGTINATATEGVYHSIQGLMTTGAGNAVLNVDGTETTGTVAGTKPAGQAAVSNGAAAHTCNFGETIHWDNYALTPAQRSALVSNQRSFWGF